MAFESDDEANGGEGANTPSAASPEPPPEPEPPQPAGGRPKLQRIK